MSRRGEGAGAIRFCIPAVLTLLAACTSLGEVPGARHDEAADCPELVRYVPDRAPGDAAAALGRGERYLLGVYGYAVDVPGRTDASLAVTIIEGTSDYRCRLLNRNARDYARRFNEVMQSKP